MVNTEEIVLRTWNLTTIEYLIKLFDVVFPEVVKPVYGLNVLWSRPMLTDRTKQLDWIGYILNVIGEITLAGAFCLGMNPGYTPIIFREEALWCVEGYGMKNAKNWHLLNLKNLEYNKMSRWHFLMNSSPVRRRH